MPTETVYGLAAAIDNPSGISRIFEIKRRPFFDPLIVHVSRIGEVHDVVRDWPAIADWLAERLWPGPLTLILPKQAGLNSMITSGLDTVGVRCPQHPFARRLIASAGVPLAAPSANLFGKTSPTTAQHVIDEFSSEQLFVIDGGPCEVGLESTVVLITVEEAIDRLTILRPGMITEQILAEVTQDWPRNVEIDRDTSNAAPGHLNAHYMPGLPLVIVAEQERLDDPVVLKRIQQSLRFPVSKWKELSLRDNPIFVARSLYASLRELSSSGADFIVVRRPDLAISGEWDAVWDRIVRAASTDLTTE